MYGVSAKPNGPWIGEDERPDLSLGRGRAMYGNVLLYVAEIRPIKLSDGVKNIESLLGDIRENLVVSYGSGADSFMDDPAFLEQRGGIKEMLDLILDDAVEQAGVSVDFMVSENVHSYGPDQMVKQGHFKPKETP